MNFIPLLRVFTSFRARQLTLSRRYTPVSSFIRLAFGFSRLTWLKCVLFYGGIFYVVLTSYLLSRRSCISHSAGTILLVYIAALWTWIGPLLIWRYEHITSIRFVVKMRGVMISAADAHRLIALCRTPATTGLVSTVFLILWMVAVLTAFVLSHDFMCGLGIRGYKDIWWVLQVTGIGLYAVLTGMGFLFVVRTMRIVATVLDSALVLNPYHPDGRGGLGCCGALLSQTSWMFSSGALFLPVLISLATSQYPNSKEAVLILISVYVLMIAASFLVPTLLLHRKLHRERTMMLACIGGFLHKMSLTPGLGIDAYLRFSHERKKYNDIRAIITWPFNDRNLAGFAVTVALPILLTLAQLYFSKK